MSREWKPGDVAIVRNRHDVWNVAICTVGLGGDQWRFGVSLTEQPVEGSEARRLVVLDPDDREQVEQLSDFLAMHGVGRSSAPDATAMNLSIQAALRSLVADPDPTPPTIEQRLADIEAFVARARRTGVAK